MAIFLISGSWPPDVCGVGDHINGLRENLVQGGVEAKAVHLPKYAAGTAITLVLRSWLRRQDRAVLAYPTEGYGRSVVPFILALSRPGSLLVHIHEYRSKNRACRWMLRLFRSQSILYFSNTADQESYLRDTGRLKKETGFASKVLPSPSNIKPLSLCAPTAREGVLRMLHFGQIRPKKGLEQVIDVFKRVKALEPSASLLIVGAVPPGYEQFANGLLSAVYDSGIELRLGADAATLSQLIADTDVMFLPYPNGADEKRGTLAAGLAHGAVCVTTHGPETSEVLREASIGIEAFEQATSGDDWADAAAKLLIESATRLRAGELGSVGIAALRYTEYASFQNLATQTVSSLFPSHAN